MIDLLNDIYTDGCETKKYRLSDFFNQWWDEYAQHPAEYITPGENISFRYRDYKNSPDRRNPVEKELTLHYREFFPRLLQHVPLRYFRIVRYYGFYSNKGNLPEEYFGRDESEIEEAGLHQEESGYENPYFCECCGRMRIYSHTTVTSGGMTYTVVLEHCDIHRKKRHDSNMG